MRTYAALSRLTKRGFDALPDFYVMNETPITFTGLAAAVVVPQFVAMNVGQSVAGAYLGVIIGTIAASIGWGFSGVAAIHVLKKDRAIANVAFVGGAVLGFMASGITSYELANQINTEITYQNLENQVQLFVRTAVVDGSLKAGQDFPRCMNNLCIRGFVSKIPTKEECGIVAIEQGGPELGSIGTLHRQNGQTFDICLPR